MLTSRYLAGWLILPVALAGLAPAAAASPASGPLAVSGTVLAGRDRPLPGAHVEIAPLPSAYASARGKLSSAAPPPRAPLSTTETGADGRFLLVVPAPGAFKVSVRAAGRVPMELGGFLLARPRELSPVLLPTAADAAARIVDATSQPGAGWRLAPPAAPSVQVPHDRGEAVRQPPARWVTVRGRALDTVTGKGVAGALVAPVADLGAVVTTGKEGRFSLDVLEVPTVAAGEGWSYEVHAPGYLPKRVGVPAALFAAGRLPSISLDPAVRVDGRALDAAGRPLAGVVLEAVPAAGLAPRPFAPSEPVVDRAGSGPDGRFQLPGLRAASRYELRARKAGYLPAALPVATASLRTGTPAVEIRMQPARAAFGRIVDPDGRPLAGVRVALRPARREDRRPPDTLAEAAPPDDDPAAARSDGDGRFRIAEVPAAEVDLEARLAGWAPLRRNGFRVAPAAAALDLGALVLRPGAKLAGRVVDGQGRAVAKAEVFLFDRLPSEIALDGALAGRKADATTGGDGGFALADLPAGTPQHLVVRAGGFLPGIVRGVRPPTAQSLLVRLEAGVQLAGRVIDEEGQPVARAEIELVSRRALEDDPYHRQLREPVTRRTVTDANGRFTVRDAPAGQAVLDISADAFLPVREMAIELPRPPQPPLVVRLRRGAVVWGRVATTAGAPVSGARVRTGNAAGITDAEGAYRLAGADEGEREVEAFHPSYRRATRTVHIEPGENRVDFDLPAGVAVEGRVVDGSGAPLLAAEVELLADAAGQRYAYSAQSDVDGRFRIEPVAAGSYRLHATTPDHATGEMPQPLVVDREPVSGLQIVVERGALLSGRVLGLAPDELAAVMVEAWAEDGRQRQGKLDAGGAYQIRALAPGAWLVRASLWQGEKEAHARVVVAPADRELTRDLEFGHKLTLSGRVLWDGEPLPDATLSVRGKRFAIERSALTAFDGAFHLDDLEPDTYWLGVSQPDQLIAHNQWLELAESREVEIRLAAASVSGTVRDAQGGKAIANALIRLTPTEGPEFLSLDSSQEDGTFNLLRVPPGSYRLRVAADGFVGAEQTVKVAAGEASGGHDFSLQPTAGAVVQVKLASGGVPPLVNVRVLDSAGNPVIAETRIPDPSGRMPLPTVPPGSWQLLLSAPSSSLLTQPLVVPGEPVAVILPPGGRLHLIVPTLATTDLLATVTLLGADQKALWTLGPGGTLQGSWPMTAGQAVIEGVPPGSWIVRAQSTDGRAWTGSATVSGGGEVAVTLE